VRVNLLKTTVQDVVQHLQSEGFVQLPAGTPLDKIRCAYDSCDIAKKQKKKKDFIAISLVLNPYL
jgi:hypothetical protein